MFLRMPSASAKLEKQMSTESYDPMKQIVTIVEKKVRNLEKRKVKLDSYRHDSQNGKELNDDQKKAVEKYDQVLELLDLAKDLMKQFNGVAHENSKAQKKAAKREQMERHQHELHRIKEIMVYQDLLNSMGAEEVRQDFLEGNKGAVKLSEEELNGLDELYKVICPERDPDPEQNKEFDKTLSTSAEHIQALLDSRGKEAFGTTYKVLRETLQKIYSCNYFNKTEEAPVEEETEEVLPVEKEEESSEQQIEANALTEVEDYVVVQQDEDYLLAQKSGQTNMHSERPYYPTENTPVYTEQAHPIQEVLSGQGNLNFLQESQIELEAVHVDPPAATPPTLPGVSYANVQYSAASQPISTATITPQHRARRPSEEAMSNHSASANLVLASSAPIQQQQPNMPPSAPLQPTTLPADFDPGRPIPTQTYTNQSFSSVVHPMMAVPPNYVPVTLPIPPAHVLPTNMPVQALPPRSAAAGNNPQVVPNPGTLSMPPAHAPASGQALQQANIYSLCLKMNQLNSENSQPAHVSPAQYDCNEAQETNVTKHPGPNFGNGGGNHTNTADSRTRPVSNAYPRGSGQVDYGNDRAYQSTNNSHAYMNRENFADNSSYSSNLKRGLTSRGGSARSTGSLRGNNQARGGRVAYRN